MHYLQFRSVYLPLFKMPQQSTSTMCLSQWLEYLDPRARRPAFAMLQGSETREEQLPKKIYSKL